MTDHWRGLLAPSCLPALCTNAGELGRTIDCHPGRAVAAYRETPMPTVIPMWLVERMTDAGFDMSGWRPVRY